MTTPLYTRTYHKITIHLLCSVSSLNSLFFSLFSTLCRSLTHSCLITMKVSTLRPSYLWLLHKPLRPTTHCCPCPYCPLIRVTNSHMPIFHLPLLLCLTGQPAKKQWPTFPVKLYTPQNQVTATSLQSLHLRFCIPLFFPLLY